MAGHRYVVGSSPARGAKYAQGDDNKPRYYLKMPLSKITIMENINMTEDMKENLDRVVYELQFDFSLRTLQCFKHENIFYVGDIVQRKELDMLKIPNFGRKSFNEVKEVLSGMGISLGMDISNWINPEGDEIDYKFRAAYSRIHFYNRILTSKVFQLMKISNKYFKELIDKRNHLRVNHKDRNINGLIRFLLSEEVSFIKSCEQIRRIRISMEDHNA